MYLNTYFIKLLYSLIIVFITNDTIRCVITNKNKETVEGYSYFISLKLPA